MNQETPTTWKYLERDLMSRLKQLSIRGRRIRACTLYGRFMSAEEPMTPEEIAADYDLPLEAVLEAIAYCQSDPPEIREDFEREERFMEAIGLKGTGRQISEAFTRGARPAWPMRIYVDEDVASALLVRLLQKAGHDVQAPAAAGKLSHSVPVQLTFAIRERRVTLTANYDDFEELHILVGHSGGHHPGILVVRHENDPARRLTSKAIVAAIRKMEAAGVPVADQYVVLNHWR